MNKLRQNFKRVVTDLQFKLSKGPLGNFVNQVKRWSRSSSRKKPDIKLGLSLPKFNLKFSLTRLGLILLVVIVVLVVGGISRAYTDIQLSTAPFAQDHQPRELVGSNVNLLLIGYDKSDNYSFVDFLAVAAVNPVNNNQKLIVLNPDFVVRVSGLPDSKLRNVMNNALLETTSPIDYLYEAVENLIGIKVDRYVALEKDNAEKFFHDFDWKYITTDDVSDKDAGIITKSTLIEDAQIVKYLGADEPGPDQRTLRQAGFLKSKFLENMNLSALIGYLTRINEATALIETDLAKNELFDLTIGLTDTNVIETLVMTVRDASFVPDTFGGRYVPDIQGIDARVSKFMGRTDVIKEQARIEIFNATGLSGHANKHKRWISNLGGRVVRTGNFPDVEERSKLYAPNIEKYLHNIELIKEVMQGNVIVVNSDFPLNHTAELVLVLGEDSVGSGD